MTMTKRLIQASFAAVLALGISTTALADKETRNTIIGAGLGGVAGALLSEGDPLYTVGGAAAGGLLGNVLTDDDHDHGRKHWDRDRGHHRSYKRANYRDNGRYHGGKHWDKRHRH